MCDNKVISASKDNVREDLIFDIGAHKGEDSDFYLKLGYRVVAVEANPSLTDALRHRFQSAIEHDRFTLVDKAISDQSGNIDFYINKDVTVWGTARPDWAERNRQLGTESEKISVESVRFLDLLKLYGCPHYVKIDIEGNDVSCVEALKLSNIHPTFISLEAEKVSWQQLVQTFHILEELGYNRFQIIDQTKHKPAVFECREGDNFSYAFEDGASGPFGRQLKRKWLTKKQAIRRFIPIFIGYKAMGDNTKLSDALRRVPFMRRLPNLIHWHDIHACRA